MCNQQATGTVDYIAVVSESISPASDVAAFVSTPRERVGTARALGPRILGGTTKTPLIKLIVVACQLRASRISFLVDIKHNGKSRVRKSGGLGGGVRGEVRTSFSMITWLIGKYHHFEAFFDLFGWLV